MVNLAGTSDAGEYAVPPGEIKTLQSMTEEDVRETIANPSKRAWLEARGDADKMFGELGSAFVRGLKLGGGGAIDGPVTRRIKALFDAGVEVRDGQDELTDRADLLSPLLDYCSVSTPPGSGDALKGTGRVPFTYQIGPRRGATLDGGRIRLEDRGLWDLRAMVTASWIAVGGEARAYLRVLKPDGKTIFSEQGHFTSTLSSQTLTLVSSVVVPEPGYLVDVWVTAASARGWWTGPQWTRLSAQHISRSVEGGTGGEDSSEPEPEPPSEPAQEGE